jgi:hypothetical protein
MADDTIVQTIQITTEGADEVEKAFQDVGKAADDSTKQIQQAAEGWSRTPRRQPGKPIDVAQMEALNQTVQSFRQSAPLRKDPQELQKLQNQLSEKGCLRPGCSSTCQWTDGNEVFSINLRAEAKLGGLGSGRRKDRGRKTVETYKTIDVNQLSEKGCLRPGCSSTCQWTDGNEVFSINLRAEAKLLHLSYPVRIGDREWRPVTDTIAIVHLPCRFGGSRAYFICPGPRGTDCGRCTTKLHLSGRYFLCRQSPAVRVSVRRLVAAGTQAGQQIETTTGNGCRAR